MYYFNDRKLALLETEVSDELESSFASTETFIVEFNKVIEAKGQDVNQFVLCGFWGGMNEAFDQSSWGSKTKKIAKSAAMACLADYRWIKN